MPAAPEASGAVRGEAVLRRLACGLALAAAPAFAVMALLAAADPAAMLCAGGASPLNGMATMYALMALFHLRPWIELGLRR